VLDQPPATPPAPQRTRRQDFVKESAERSCSRQESQRSRLTKVEYLLHVLKNMAAPIIEPSGDTDFFISYRGAGTDWARWVNWVVRSAGFSTMLMDEFQVGTTWTSNMRASAEGCRRLIALYSEDYWLSGPCREEFDAYWLRHMQNDRARFLIPLEIQTCSVPGIHAVLLRKPLHSLSRDAAHAAILKVLEGISPAAPPIPFVDLEPPFPGALSAASATVTDWPESVAELKWPLADHDAARAAFAELVTRNSRFKFLAIHGSSETGKSHLTMQFLTNAQRRVSACRSARFDFKGTDRLDDTLADFAHLLEVPLPPATGSLTDGFRLILQHLAQRRRPTLLVFDTYEDVGEADRWVRDSLLTSLHRHLWLRLVIAGQEVPVCHGRPWEEDSTQLRIEPPDPDHWMAYAKANQRTITPSTLAEVHKLTAGKASILAQLCGPHS